MIDLIGLGLRLILVIAFLSMLLFLILRVLVG